MNIQNWSGSPRTFYLVALIIWLAFTILYPPWSGRFYNQEQAGTTGYFSGGTFGLIKSSFWEDHHPLWAPPKPHSPEIEATLRMPWEPVSSRSHIEPAVDAMVLQISLGILAIGICFLAWNRGSAPILRPAEGIFHQMVWSVTVFNGLAIIVAFALVVLSTGYAPEVWYFYILSLGNLAGLLHGVASTLRL